jgi:phenylacetate-CoA ligase
LVFTTLTKEGMPVIRYRTRDLCTLIPGQCDCGRTSIRMGRIEGRSDDMLIIRGINVFPSQVESVVLSMPEFAPHYLLIVDRVKNLDTLLVQVEIRQEYFTGTFDTPAAIDALEKKLASKLKSVLSISAKVQLKAPGTIQRSQGKSAHVIDNRKL